MVMPRCMCCAGRDSTGAKYAGWTSCGGGNPYGEVVRSTGGFSTGMEVTGVAPYRLSVYARRGDTGDSSIVEFVGLENCWKVGACISSGVSKYE